MLKGLIQDWEDQTIYYVASCCDNHHRKVELIKRNTSYIIDSTTISVIGLDRFNSLGFI